MWVELTVAKYKQRFSEAESDAVLEQQASVDATIEEFLRQIAAEVVASVNKCRRTRGLPPVSPPARYVPPGSERHAYTLAQSLQATSLVRSLGDLQGEVRTSAVTKAEDHITALAACDIDSDDEGAADYVTGTGTTVPQFGGMQKMDFIGGTGVNEPLITSEEDGE